MTSQDFVYTTYIKTTPEKVWTAITNPEFTRQFWVHENVSDWKKGSKWQHVYRKENLVRLVGEVIESAPPKKLVLTWADAKAPDDNSTVTFEIDAVDDMVRLTVRHGDFKPDSKLPAGISMGWPLVLSSMKSFLETGKPIDIMAWKMPCKAA